MYENLIFSKFYVILKFALCLHCFQTYTSIGQKTKGHHITVMSVELCHEMFVSDFVLGLILQEQMYLFIS